MSFNCMAAIQRLTLLTGALSEAWKDDPGTVMKWLQIISDL